MAENDDILHQDDGLESCPMCDGKGFHEGEDLPESVTGSADNLSDDAEWLDAPEGCSTCFWCQGVGDRPKRTVH